MPGPAVKGRQQVWAKLRAAHVRPLQSGRIVGGGALDAPHGSY